MKKIALINDMSGFGRCSLTAAIPVISVMGIQACPLPTAILSAQTGFENIFCDDFTNRMDLITDHWKELGSTFDGIYSGYMEGGWQIEKVLHFLETFQTGDTFYLADPVMGDHGNPYPMFTPKLLSGMKELIKRADVITPNLTELCMLAGQEYANIARHKDAKDYTERIAEISEKLIAKAEKTQTIITTGIIRSENGCEYIGNLAVTKDEVYYTEHPYTGMGFSGTGDLFASVICASMVKGLDVSKALKKADSFLQDAILEASDKKMPAVHGVPFEHYLSRLCKE